MIYPIEKYTFVEVPAKKDENEPNGYIRGPRVIALSTFAGQTVKGVAKCHPHDIENYNLADGMELAAARCGVNVAEKRFQRAIDKMADALDVLNKAETYYRKMRDYMMNSHAELEEATAHLAKIEGKPYQSAQTIQSDDDTAAEVVGYRFTNDDEVE